MNCRKIEARRVPCRSFGQVLSGHGVDLREPATVHGESCYDTESVQLEKSATRMRGTCLVVERFSVEPGRVSRSSAASSLLVSPSSSVKGSSASFAPAEDSVLATSGSCCASTSPYCVSLTVSKRGFSIRLVISWRLARLYINGSKCSSVSEVKVNVERACLQGETHQPARTSLALLFMKPVNVGSKDLLVSPCHDPLDVVLVFHGMIRRLVGEGKGHGLLLRGWTLLDLAEAQHNKGLQKQQYP